MDVSAQKNEKPKCGPRAALLNFLALSLAFFFFLAMTLALGTLLVPIGSKVNLALCLVTACMLTVLFSRRVLSCGEVKSAEAPPARSRGFIIGSLAGLALACACVLSLVHNHWHGEAETAKRLLAFRGFPVSLEEFQEDLPDSEYAYPALARTVEGDFDPAFYDKSEHEDGGVSRWDPETIKREAASSAHYAAYLEKDLAPLLRRKHARYMKVDHLQASRDPLNVPAPKLGNLSAISKIAKTHAVSLAAKGNAEKAWEMVRLQFALADLLSGDRTLLAKMVTLAIRRQGADAAAGILLNRPGASLPKDIRLRLQSASAGSLAVEGLRGELAYLFDIYNFIHGLEYKKFREHGGFSGILLTGSGSVSGAGPGFDYFLFSVLRRMGLVDLNAAAAAGYFSTAAEPGSWAETSERSREAESRISGLPFWPFLLVKYSLPSFAVRTREFEVQARARMTLALAELQRFRRERGKYPRKLSEVKPGPAPDVFSGGGFLYEPAAGGFDLCSAGAAGDRKEASSKDFCIRLRP